MLTTISQAEMQDLYYGINPPRHAEKAHRKGDRRPEIAPIPTEVGASGKIVVLVTTLDNKPPFDEAAYAVHDTATGHEIHEGSGKLPFRDEISGLTPGTQLYIQPLTLGTMAKILTPEQIAARG